MCTLDYLLIYIDQLSSVDFNLKINIQVWYFKDLHHSLLYRGKEQIHSETELISY